MTDYETAGYDPNLQSAMKAPEQPIKQRLAELEQEFRAYRNEQSKHNDTFAARIARLEGQIGE